MEARKCLPMVQLGVSQAIWTITCFRSYFIFPFIAALVNFNGNFARVPLLGIWWEMPILAATKVYLFYFGLLFLFLGSFLDAWRCPEFIKRYENSLEYVKSELDVLVIPATAETVIKFTIRRLEQHRPTVGKLHDSSVQSLDSAIQEVSNQISARISLEKNPVSAWMFAHWTFMTRSFPLTRAWTTIFYLCGIGLIGLVSALSVVQVLWHFLY
jgi:hypothetical protein